MVNSVASIAAGARWCSPLPVAGFVLGIGLGDHGGGVVGI